MEAHKEGIKVIFYIKEGNKMKKKYRQKKKIKQALDIKPRRGLVFRERSVKFCDTSKYDRNRAREMLIRELTEYQV